MVESRIIKALRESGYKVVAATAREDKYDKVDCYIFWKGRWEPLQIKYRSSRNDIVMEVTFLDDKNYDSSTKFNGRDFISKAKMLASLSADGRVIRLCSMAELKQNAELLTRQLLVKKRSQEVLNSSGTAKARKVVDCVTKRKKVLYFVEPTELKTYKPIYVSTSSMIPCQK